MSRGSHAADDGSFGRSASGAMVRGVALIVVAVALGIILLLATDGPDPLTPATGPPAEDDTTTTTVQEPDELPTTDPPTTELDPSTITVLVSNAAGVSGLAGDLTEVVAAEGFETAAPVTGPEQVETSTVYYAPGFEEAAEAVAELFDTAPEVAPLPDPSPVEDLAGADVVIVAGPDLVPE